MTKPHGRWTVAKGIVWALAWLVMIAAVVALVKKLIS